MPYSGRWLKEDDPIRVVYVVGGTHGNERNGVYIKRWLETLSLTFETYQLHLLESNPQAVKCNVRYTETDLNREFELCNLGDPSRTELYEQRRAKELDALMGPKASPTPAADLVIDLHNTTSNTGTALMFHPQDTVAMELAARVVREDPSAVAVNWLDTDPRVLPSVGRSGMTFEVGPCSWGVIEPRSFQQTQRNITALLQYIDHRNKVIAGGASATREEVSIRVFANAGKPVPYPRDTNGDIIGAVHPSLADFSAPLTADTPIIRMFTGETVTWQKDGGEQEVYPFFVNEAAYYEKDIAFMVASRRVVSVPILSTQ